jgi:hypothetical protein
VTPFQLDNFMALDVMLVVLDNSLDVSVHVQIHRLEQQLQFSLPPKSTHLILPLRDQASFEDFQNEQVQNWQQYRVFAQHDDALLPVEVLLHQVETSDHILSDVVADRVIFCKMKLELAPDAGNVKVPNGRRSIENAHFPVLENSRKSSSGVGWNLLTMVT